MSKIAAAIENDVLPTEEDSCGEHIVAYRLEVDYACPDDDYTVTYGYVRRPDGEVVLQFVKWSGAKKAGGGWLRWLYEWVTGMVS